MQDRHESRHGGPAGERHARAPLGQLSLTCLVVANMIGVGVFTTSGFALAELGSAHRVMAAWLAGGIIAFAGALSYAALARRVLESGGEYVFLARLIHPFAGFLAGWVSLLAGFTGSIAFAALALEAYTSPLLPAWVPPHTAAIAVIAITALLHGVRVETGALVQNAIVLLKLTLLVAFIGLAIVMADGVAAAQPPRSIPPLSAGAFAGTLVWISLSYSGFNAAVYVAGEAREAAVRVPRALWLGTFLVTILYFALNAVFLYLAPHDAVAGRADVAAAAARAIGGPGLEAFVRLLVMLALLTSVFSLMMAGPRVYARMADDGLFPASYRYRGRAPHAAIALQAVLAALVVLAADLRDLLGYLGLTLSLSAAATVGALFFRRDAGAGVSRGGTVSGPGFPAPLLFIAATLLAAAFAAWRNPAEILAAAITLASGGVLYWIMTRKRGAECCGTLILLLAMTAGTLSADEAAGAADPYADARAKLVREIEADVRATRGELGKSALDPRVIAAMGRVPRHEFVPEDLRALAYFNEPLPIGHEQTISQPYIVAIMTDLLALPPGARVLEVGTGSGYQAAVLAELAAEVYSIEIVEPLGLQAKHLLERLGYANVHVRIGDGYAGWPAKAPFDGIIVTAAAPGIPEPLIEQLGAGGRMIIPLEGHPFGQDLVLVEKDSAGRVRQRKVMPVMFVPLTGEGATGSD